MPQTALKAIMFADVVGYTAMMQRDRVAAMTAVKGLISDETPAFRLPLIPVHVVQYDGKQSYTYSNRRKRNGVVLSTSRRQRRRQATRERPQAQPQPQPHV